MKVVLDGVPQTLEPTADGTTITLSNSSLRIEMSAAAYAMIQLPEIEDPLKGLAAVILIDAEVKRIIESRVRKAMIAEAEDDKTWQPNPSNS